MIDTILYLGLTQSIFAGVTIGFKTPKSITDKILVGWLIHIAFIFSFSLYRSSFLGIPGNSWVGDLNALISFPPFIYLYAKYSVQEVKAFEMKDLWHFFPALLSIIILMFVADWPSKGFAFGYQLLNTKVWFRNVLGIYLIFSLWIYLYRSYILVKDYRRRIVDLFSYHSEKNNYIWLQVVIVTFAVMLNLTIVFGALNEHSILQIDVNAITKSGIVLFVYAVSFWGYRQNQLIIQQKDVKSKAPKESSYSKTGLKKDDIQLGLEKLIKAMEETEIWKNSELSVADLSYETKLPKHYITQLLNDNLKKNFYTFVNEYRCQRAMQMLRSEEYSNWTILGISFECGFNSKSAFNSFFKKHTGTTPSAYQKSKEV